MSEPVLLNCDDCQQLLEEYALEELSDDLNAQISDHLASGCQACNRRLGDIVTGLAMLPAGLAQESPPARLERELMARIARRQPDPPAAAESYTPALQCRSRSRLLTIRLVGAAAALAAGVMGVAAWFSWTHGLWQQQFNNDAGTWAELEQRFDEAEESQRFLSVSQLQFVSLRNPSLDAQVRGHIIVDEASRQWHVYVFNLPALPEGRQFQLWLETGDGNFVSAGTIQPDSSGIAGQLIDPPLDLGAIRGIGISDEPLSASDRPTGDSRYRAEFP
jgi:anti-sigma-K factor RskA